MKTGSSKKVYPLMKVDTPFFISCLRKKHVGFTVLYKKKIHHGTILRKKKSFASGFESVLKKLVVLKGF